MNLHIQNHRLRFRITREELELLCADGEEKPLQQELFFPDRHMLRIQIKSVVDMKGAQPMEISFDGQSIVLYVSQDSALQLRKSLPSREGIKVEQAVASASEEQEYVLTILLEVDIRTQKHKRAKGGGRQ